MSNVIQSSLLTAVILTWNEEENIARTLSHLTWLEKVIIIDSDSTDKTAELAASFSNIEFHIRAFDTHANQWNFGLNLCNSEWILSLDADYILPYSIIEEIKQNITKKEYSAFDVEFDFVIFEMPLNANNTTPRPILFTKKDCIYYDDGHTQRLQIKGKKGTFKNKILHDDRKPLSRWLYNQAAYSTKEAHMLLNTNKNLSFLEKLRKKRIYTPLLMFFFCLFRKRMIFNGWRGWHYTLQRTIVEMLISLRLTEEKINDKRSRF